MFANIIKKIFFGGKNIIDKKPIRIKLFKSLKGKSKNELIRLLILQTERGIRLEKRLKQKLEKIQN